jgi:hypothetical protein
MVYYMPQKFHNCSRLVTTYHGGQKNRNGKTTAFFFTIFSTSDGIMVDCFTCTLGGPNVVILLDQTPRVEW